jgi:ferric-dicitrate binding protein FerR (iron transport regulator)
MTKEEIYEWISGFLNGELTGNELIQLNRWLDEDDAHLDEFNRLRSVWILSHHDTGRKKFAAYPEWQKLQRKIDRHAVRSGTKGLLRHLTPVRYAASLLICLALGAASAMMLRPPVGAGATVAPAASTVVKAPLGSKSHIILPDSSVVWLNAGSTLRYSSDFGTQRRELHLSGEAFFEVKSDASKPFNVHTQGMTVRALGTRFNVKAYPDDHTLATTLEEGIVDVLIHSPAERKPSLITLKPKEQLIIRKSQKEQPVSAETIPAKPATASASSMPANREITLQTNVKTELATSWKDKKWIISDKPLELFVTDLERRYNLQIRFMSEELKAYKFSGTIENETAEQILTALSIAAPVRYKFDKNRVMLTLNRSSRDKFDKLLKTNK